MHPDTANPTRLSPPGGSCHDGLMSAPPLRVMLVDDHEVVRDGIKLLLADTDDVVVCAEAGSAREAVAVATRALPDVIVMDVRLSDGSGIEATRDIRAARPHTQVLMLTSFADDEALFASIMAGAAGYVLKQIRGEELVRAIRAVGAGQNLLDPAVTKGVFDRLRKGKHLLRDERLARLSPQENASWGWSPRAGPTARSAPSWGWPRRRSRTTSRPSWPSSRSPAGPKPPPTWPATPPSPAPEPAPNRRGRRRALSGSCGGEPPIRLVALAALALPP
jgi:two-component system, NarL family, response regulator DevR